MSVHVTDYHTVFADPEYYCGPGPAIITDPAGRITVAFRRVLSWLEEDLAGHWHPATESCLTHSSDTGRHWSSPTVFQAGCQCPNLRRLVSGRWIHHTHRFELINEQIQEKIVAAGGVPGTQPWPAVQRGTSVQFSDDEGHNWSPFVYLDGVPDLPPRHPRLHAPVAVRGNVLETGDGRLLLSAYCGGQTNTAYLFASDDTGVSFDYAGVIAADHNETSLLQTSSGRLVAFMRRWSDPQYLSKCHSDDGGRNWSDPVQVCAGYPACALILPSGRVLIVYGYRFDDEFGTRARCLDAECDDVDGEEILLRGDGGVADLGYPDATLLPDGRVGVVYYHNRGHAHQVSSRCPRYIEMCVLEES